MQFLLKVLKFHLMLAPISVVIILARTTECYVLHHVVDRVRTVPAVLTIISICAPILAVTDVPHIVGTAGAFECPVQVLTSPVVQARIVEAFIDVLLAMISRVPWQNKANFTIASKCMHII